MNQTIIIPLKIDGLDCRSHNIVGIYELDNEIVFLHTILGDVPKEQIKKDTIFPNYVIADFFSHDFELHSQNWLIYPEKKVLYVGCCECESREDYLLLNTLYYQPVGSIMGDDTYNNFIAKLITIKKTGLCEIGESPKPFDKKFCDSKTFAFGDYDVHMSSYFTMECSNRITATVIWKLKLNAYLYTDVEEKDGILYFGTAGKGGRFYGVCLQKGNILFAYDTGGTVQYTWHGVNALVIDRKGDIVLLDYKTGIETKRLGLRKQKLHAIPQMFIKGNKLYTVAYRNNDYYDFYALCIDL